MLCCQHRDGFEGEGGDGGAYWKGSRLMSHTPRLRRCHMCICIMVMQFICSARLAVGLEFKKTTKHKKLTALMFFYLSEHNILIDLKPHS